MWNWNWAWVSWRWRSSADLEGTLCQPAGRSPAARWGSAGGFSPCQRFGVRAHRAAIPPYGVPPVIGTTGLSPKQLRIWPVCRERPGIRAAIIPNFSVGKCVLLQQVRAAAARFTTSPNSPKLHHNRKARRPSGTCLKAPPN